MPPTTKWAAAQATAARIAQCRTLLEAIGTGLNDYAAAAAAGPQACHWGHAGTVDEVRRQLQQIADALGCPTGEQVAAEHACPHCGERHSDLLAWIDDETVRCFGCGTTYQP